MASLNKVMLIGSLGKDVELRYTNSGTAVAGFSLATTEKVKSGDSYEDKTEWHTITMWGRLAEIAGEFLAKGKSVYIEGRLQTRKWQDKNGNDRYTTEIVAEKMQMLSPKGDKGSAGTTTSGAKGSQEPPPGFGPDDDVPF